MIVPTLHGSTTPGIPHKMHRATRASTRLPRKWRGHLSTLLSTIAQREGVCLQKNKSTGDGAPLPQLLTQATTTENQDPEHTQREIATSWWPQARLVPHPERNNKRTASRHDQLHHPILVHLVWHREWGTICPFDFAQTISAVQIGTEYWRQGGDWRLRSRHP